MLLNKVNLALAKSLKEEYQNAIPFPHIVIDNFLPEDVANEAHDLFPAPEDMDITKYQEQENKININPTVPGFPEKLKPLMYALNSHEMLSFLEILTGINGILPDPTFVGGGLHLLMEGGKLGIHVDFNYHKHYRLNRRQNALIFLNKDWKEEYGGHLELWDENMKTCVKKISPIHNRCVIFNTTDNSYHGHPDPMTAPPSVTRKSIALYYYSNGRPEDNAKEVFWTEHQKRPNGNDYRFETPVKKLIRQITPPIIFKVLQSVIF